MTHFNSKTAGYASPDCEVLIIKSEGVFCTSGGDMDYNSSLDEFNQKDDIYWN